MPWRSCFHWRSKGHWARQHTCQTPWNAAHAICSSLTSLLNASLLQGRFQNKWKGEYLTPCQGLGTSMKWKPIYWPFSALPVLAKVLESTVHEQHFEYLEKNMILSEEQDGIRPNRSTQDVLLIAIDDWKKVLGLGQTMTTVMIELSKAFDSINHNLVLRSYGHAWCRAGMVHRLLGKEEAEGAAKHHSIWA